MPSDELLLPERSVLLHIGPHKTGTTAVQSAFYDARNALAAHGAAYCVGAPRRQPLLAAQAVTGGSGLLGDPPPRPGHWQDLVREVAANADRRVVVSSEFFCDADPEAARRIVRDLGRDRVHVVVTLRPLAKILPSAWQQYVRNRLVTSYDDWLKAMLTKPPYVRPTPTFWKRHHHDVLVERWAAVVGPENVTVVVVDESDRHALLRTFERLVGLPDGMLVHEPSASNRSLTWTETELVRRLNVEFKARGWSTGVYRQFIRDGLVAQLQLLRQPGPEEPRITTPGWALERVAEIGAVAADKIGQTGVRVIGNLASLGAGPSSAEASASAQAPDADDRLGFATEAVVASILASGVTAPTDPGAMLGVRSRDLAVALVGRVRRPLGRAVRKRLGRERWRPTE